MAALGLRSCYVRVHQHTAIHRAGKALHLHARTLHGNLRHLRHHGAGIQTASQPARAPGRQRRAPAGPFGCRQQHRLKAFAQLILR